MIDQRHAVVTGGTGALGSAVVGRLLADGVRCHVTYVDERELRGYAHTQAVDLQRVDVFDEAAVQAFYAALPQLDASVHLVGGFAMKSIADTTLADFERMLKLNAGSAFLCSREAIGRMRGRGGRIVNVAARPALVPTAGMIAYATSKAAVAALTQALSAEVAAEGIFVNAVVPSTMDTPANRRSMPDADFARWPKV
ncbi:MAG TPA: SDR family NAD(P)-dependent oxidoreductase, partial [Polyangiales bacterium]|nr:SDR family NAD(P)-dependent oxidoreductase [Polyangiales bacterium]